MITRSEVLSVLTQIETDLVRDVGTQVIEVMVAAEEVSNFFGGFYKNYPLPESDISLTVTVNTLGEGHLSIRTVDGANNVVMLRICELETMGDGVVLTRHGESLPMVMSNVATFMPEAIPVVVPIIAYLMKEDESEEPTKVEQIFEETLHCWPRWNALFLSRVYDAHARGIDLYTNFPVGTDAQDGLRPLMDVKLSRKKGCVFKIDFKMLDKPFGGDMAYYPRKSNLSLLLKLNEHGEPYEIEYPYVDKKEVGLTFPDHLRNFYRELFTHNGYNIFDW